MCLSVRYHIHNILSIVYILSHISAVHNFSTYFFNIYFSIIHFCMPLFFKWLLTFRVSCQNPVCILCSPCACYMTLPSYPPWFYNRITVVECVNDEGSCHSIFSVLSSFFSRSKYLTAFFNYVNNMFLVSQCWEGCLKELPKFLIVLLSFKVQTQRPVRF